MTPEPGIVTVEDTLDDEPALIRLRRDLAACTDLEQLYALLTTRLPELLPVRDRVSIVFLEPDRAWLRIHRLLPATGLRETLPRVRVDGTPVGEVARDGIVRVVSDVRTDPNITFGHASHDGIRSTVSVPIKLGTVVIGALNAGSRTTGACTEAMVPGMERLAAIIGPAFYAIEQNDLLGVSPAFRSMLDVARRAARSDADVLITGETGVGKTALARALHAWSPRRAGPFVTVHLADLAPTLVEAELFGYERGAFTGALTDRMGRFESAAGGTIFLDEISEAPPAIQTKLLRIIHDRCFERVGGGQTIRADVRIIAASNKDLRAAIRRGDFREDLYFRLGVVPIHVPPLRERGDDLDLLVGAILARLGTADGRARRLSAAAIARVRAYAWPGNIRELEAALRRATILEDTDELALAGLELASTSEAEAAAPAALAGERPDGRWLTLDEHQRAYIEQVLQAHDGAVEGVRGAARVLGVPPSTLRSRMKRLGVAVRRGKGHTR